MDACVSAHTSGAVPGGGDGRSVSAASALDDYQPLQCAWAGAYKIAGMIINLCSVHGQVHTELREWMRTCLLTKAGAQEPCVRALHWWLQHLRAIEVTGGSRYITSAYACSMLIWGQGSDAWTTEL
eukprot:1154344-Pelagomonas_calceolata.AAC.9